MSSKQVLIDRQGRRISYLRLALTERCNLRCRYCMPERTHFAARDTILSFEEIIRLVNLLATRGMDKIRFTGGEPFVRNGFMDLLTSIRAAQPSMTMRITTNGTQISPSVIKKLRAIGITQLTVSLDSLRAENYFRITRRDLFHATYECIMDLLAADFAVKINVVVMENVNTDELINFIQWASRYKNLSIRFIEQMPFRDITGAQQGVLHWDYARMLATITAQIGEVQAVLHDKKSPTALHYTSLKNNYSFSIIPAYSRLFCGACNRLRVTAQGGIKTCLYGTDVLNVRDMLRSEQVCDQDILHAIENALQLRARNGFEAEKRQADAMYFPSMNRIGG